MAVAARHPQPGTRERSCAVPGRRVGSTSTRAAGSPYFPNGGRNCEYGGLELGLRDESALLPCDLVVVGPGPEQAVIELRARMLRTPLTALRRLPCGPRARHCSSRTPSATAAALTFPLSYGQHIVFGPPLLSPACRIDVPGASVHDDAEAVQSTSNLELDSRSTWPAVRHSDGTERNLSRVPGPEARTGQTSSTSMTWPTAGTP